ncbi:hypothetical protein ADN00_14950 [Ornatilinea apprima]|uniref:Uncharacterized protein n=1 Tax=Ornatilinea apprima TaxID=1134406 RepID=A0A0P6X1G6_9CHLR|nr:hypothetical protein [Ornatilinea apprima]KPL73086.1 hypothetical protein ADN00_14950 [Ornatilinea apprima]
MSKEWHIPEGFSQVESKLPGVTVFAPVKQVNGSRDKLVTYTCPRCGAVTRYDIAAGGVACEHCGYVHAVQTQVAGKAAEEHEFRVDVMEKANHVQWTAGRKDLVCEQCGAATSVPENAISGTCSFCASNKIHIADLPVEELQPKYIIPFSINQNQLKTIVSNWLGKGWFHPQSLSSSATVNSFRGVYLPFWTFDAEINADWKALVGYERSERYYDAGSKEWKTRTTIDWRWEDGQVNQSFDDILIPGTRKVSQRILEEIQPFDLNALQSFSPDFLAGWQANHFDLSLQEAWDTAKDKMREKNREACYADIPTHHVRNFSMSADFANETWRYIFLPVFLSTYHFEEKKYQVMINGQTGEIAGQKPVEWWKIWAAIAASLSPGFLLLLIGLPLLLAGGIGIVPLILGFVLLVAGIIFSVSLYKKAVESEAE